jgi:hypothetical protein
MSSKHSELGSPGIKNVLSAVGSKETLKSLQIVEIEDDEPKFGDEDNDSQIHNKQQFPDLDEDGDEYCDNIVQNVIYKLKLALNIPNDAASHEQLQDFFIDKFRQPVKDEFAHNMPDEPSLEMLNAKVFGHIQEVETKQEEVKQ